MKPARSVLPIGLGRGSEMPSRQERKSLVSVVKTGYVKQMCSPVFLATAAAIGSMVKGNIVRGFITIKTEQTLFGTPDKLKIRTSAESLPNMKYPVAAIAVHTTVTRMKEMFRTCGKKRG